MHGVGILHTVKRHWPRLNPDEWGVLVALAFAAASLLDEITRWLGAAPP